MRQDLYCNKVSWKRTVLTANILLSGKVSFNIASSRCRCGLNSLSNLINYEPNVNSTRWVKIASVDTIKWGASSTSFFKDWIVRGKSIYTSLVTHARYTRRRGRATTVTYVFVCKFFTRPEKMVISLSQVSLSTKIVNIHIRRLLENKFYYECKTTQRQIAICGQFLRPIWP